MYLFSQIRVLVLEYMYASMQICPMPKPGPCLAFLLPTMRISFISFVLSLHAIVGPVAAFGSLPSSHSTSAHKAKPCAGTSSSGDKNECPGRASSTSSSSSSSTTTTTRLLMSSDAAADTATSVSSSTSAKAQKFAIIGHNIAYSVSPAMHNAAYEALSLPHTYGLIDEESVDTIVQSDFWNDADFRGMSVTIPHKQSIMPHLDELSDAAREIGAVNTVIVDRCDDGTSSRTLRGDNTDWVGIYNPLKARLGDGAISGGAALILGAGGTARAAAYAATQLGLERVYYNRTPAKAQELADAFGGTVVTDLSGPSDEKTEKESKTLGDVCKDTNTQVRVVLSTLPAAAGFELPDWLAKDTSTIVFDVNYKPYWTPLLRQAEAAGLDIVRGSEMLWEQGVGQFELWLAQDAPYEVMKTVVLENCLPKEDE